VAASNVLTCSNVCKQRPCWHEHSVVVLDVVGSNPIAHPIGNRPDQRLCRLVFDGLTRRWASSGAKLCHQRLLEVFCWKCLLEGRLNCGNSHGQVGQSALPGPTALCRTRVFWLADLPMNSSENARADDSGRLTAIPATRVTVRRSAGSGRTGQVALSARPGHPSGGDLAPIRRPGMPQRCSCLAGELGRSQSRRRSTARSIASARDDTPSFW
jgi:hypothetical protein